MKKYIVLSGSILLLLLTSIIINPLQFYGMVVPDAPQECSNFSVKHGDQVFFGSNDDMPPDRLSVSEAAIRIYPPTTTGQGYAEFGYFTPEGKNWAWNGWLNESGLAIGTMSIPARSVKPHPEKPIKGVVKFLISTMRNASSVEEVIELALQTDFSFGLGDTWWFQIQFADATGDSVVISPGLDGGPVITRKPVSQAYLVSTNFNPALPEGTKAGLIDSYERYDTAVTLLEYDLNVPDFSEVNARRVLEAVHIEWFGSFAASSRVFDLQNGEIYLYHYSQFDNGVKLNLADELKKGYQQIRVRDLFPKEVLEQGESRHKSIAMRDLTTLVFFLAVVVSFLGSLIGFLVVVVRNRGNDNANAAPVKLRLFMAIGIFWSVSCWSLLQMLNNIYPPNLINPIFPMQAMLVLGPLGGFGAIVAVRAFATLRKDESVLPRDDQVSLEGVS